jgi:hypothetical protein
MYSGKDLICGWIFGNVRELQKFINNLNNINTLLERQMFIGNLIRHFTWEFRLLMLENLLKLLILAKWDFNLWKIRSLRVLGEINEY